MTQSMLGQNIRRLRLEQNMTQQALAERLSVAPQSVSKWETGLTLPDVTLLPAIAGCFRVTIDTLFQPAHAAYRHRAACLLAQYELQPRNWRLFHQTAREYQAQLQSMPDSAPDWADYGYLQERCARELLFDAEASYRKAMDNASEPDIYKMQRQWIQLLSYLGRGEEAVQRCRDQLQAKPEEPQAYVSLLAAYLGAHRLDSAEQLLSEALCRFPDHSLLLMYAGEFHRQHGDAAQAESDWKRAWAADPDMIDAQYALAELYAAQQRDTLAEDALKTISEWQEAHGF